LPDLKEFVANHRPHGTLTPTLGEPTPRGYMLELACPCGVPFMRWMTAPDLVEDVLRERLRVERN